MTTKHITKTTKEYKYDEKGFIVKEVITEEYYEEEIVEIKSGVHTGTVTTTGDTYTKVTGIPHNGPYTSTFEASSEGGITVTGSNITYDPAKADTNGVTHNVTVNGDLKIPTKNINDIASEVKAILERDLKTFSLKRSL